MNKTVKALLFFIFFAITICVLWDYFGKSIYLNHTSRMARVTILDQPKLIPLAKWEDQKVGQTYGIEIEINGITDRTLTLLFGPEKNGMMQQVLLKKGSIDFEYMRDWYSDSCYLFFPSKPGAKIDLEINYRFMGDAGESFIR